LDQIALLVQIAPLDQIALLDQTESTNLYTMSKTRSFVLPKKSYGGARKISKKPVDFDMSEVHHFLRHISMNELYELSSSFELEKEEFSDSFELEKEELVEILCL